jgi:hypothetical protein
MATDYMQIQGTVNLASVLRSGNFTDSYTYLGETYTTPTVGSGGASCDGTVQGSGAGGGGGSTDFTSCLGGTLNGSDGGTGYPTGISGGTGSTSTKLTSGGSGFGCSASSGSNGNASGGGGGSSSSTISKTFGSCTGWHITASSSGGAGAST